MRCLIALMLLALQAEAAEGRWLKLDTPGFQILSQTSEAELLTLADQLQTAAAILGTLEPGAGKPSGSVRVFIFTSRRDFERYSANGNPTEHGYYHFGSGGEVIAFLHTGTASRSVILHESGHLAIRRAGGRVPSWLDEGLAELYSTIRIQGEQVVWGGPAELRLPHLASGRLLDARKFFDTTKMSGRFTDSEAGRFYSQAWAFTHMLQFGQGYSGGLAEFRRLLAQNMPEEDAFKQAFGKSRTSALAELPIYLRAGRFREQRLPVGALPSLVAGHPSQCSREEVSFALAGLLVHLGRIDQARGIYEQLAGIDGSNAESLKLLGDLALAQDLRDEAGRYYERAIAMGSKDAALHFEYAMLLRDADAPPERVQRLLDRALKFDANLPGLQQFLANRALDEGDHELAIKRFSGAALLQPDSPAIWLGLAYAHRAAENREAARDAAQRSAKFARDEAGRSMAAAALEELESPQAAPPARPGPRTIVPDSWKNRQGDRRLEGTLVRIDCEGTSAKLHLRTAGGITIFSVSDPSKVVLRNTPGASREFRCGAFDGVKVAVEFVAATESRKDTAGEVTALEFQ